MRFITSFLSDKEGSLKKDISVLTLFFGITVFQFLGRMPLYEPDEGRYAEIPREMLERCDFITPFLNYVKYFEKPPLHYWLNVLSFTIFGRNEFAARFPGALMGLITVILTYHVGRKLFCRPAGVLAALILGTSTGFLFLARLDITDMTLTCTLSAALAFFLLASREGEQRKTLYYHLFYLCAALALLAKGLIGIVFPCAIIFFYLLITRRWRLLVEMRPWTGIPLFFLVAAPWFIAVSWQNPEFARFFFIHEHFERFLTKVHGRYKPFWYFIPVLAGTMLPWSLFIPTAIKGSWKERVSSEGESRLYLALWVLLIFLFFSESDSKLIPYILPVFPPLALLLGSAFTRLSDTVIGFVKTESYIIAGLLCCGGAGAICYPIIASKPDFPLSSGVVIGGILLGGGVITFLNVFRGSLPGLLTGLVFCFYFVGIAGPSLLLSEMAKKRTVKEPGIFVREKAGKDAVVASFGLLQGFSFYAERRVVIIGDPGETDFGSRRGDNSAWFIDFPRFILLWNSPATVFTLLTEEEYKGLQVLLRTSPRIVVKTEKYILITNR
jgi:4-amino-4-deoxy-L-arabinose transferase-like glycosyltransferase